MDEGGLVDVGAMPPEEEGAGFLPFLLLIVLVGAGWWFWSNSSAQTSPGTAAAAPKPNPEELRRKRLEALEASMTSQQPVATTPAAAEAPATGTTATAKTPEGARERPQAAAPPDKPMPEKPKPKMEEDGVRKRAVPEAQKAAVPAPAPAKEAPVSAKENTPPPAAPERFALRARATLQGASVLRSLEGVEASTTVQRLRDMAQKAFLPDAKGQTLRIFFSGKELKEPGLSAKQLGLSENACLQVMFSAPSAAPAQSQAPAVTPPAAEELTVRLQGTVGGRTCSHMIEELTTASSVSDLEGLALGAFEPGPEMKPRLFFMGRELKEAETFLGHVGLKTKSTATVQVMFAAGEPRAVAKVPATQKPPAAEASETTQGESSTSAPPPTSVLSPEAFATAAGAAQAETGNAVMAAAEAAGCNVSALMGGSSTESGGAEEISPAEAWRAMAALEEQLARETDFSEDASVRQASTLLRQMLTTAAHESNPALIQMAQVMVPDLKKIWGFEPTRDHLKGLLAMKAGSAASS